jgi:SAM-dependent methyltransferase
MAAFKDHFSSNTAGYATHRPTYPPNLITFLADISPAHDLALDVACGTGQLSVGLADRFTQVVATDASAQQIASATPHERISYHAAPAEQSGLPDASADLITVAQAAHWLDLDVFYAEARRVARPQAIIALITYGVLHVEGDAADAATQHFYHDVIGPYWPPERKHVEDGYSALPFPFEPVATPALAITRSWVLDDLIGYIDTWSAVRAAEKAVGRAPIERFRTDLARAWGDPTQPRQISWPLSLRVGRIA